MNSLSAGLNWVQTDQSSLTVGVVLEMSDNCVTIAPHDDPGAPLVCRVLRPAGAPVRFPRPGCEVLPWVDVRAGQGVVLGSLGPSETEAPEDIPDELVIEAKQELTLRVGK